MGPHTVRFADFELDLDAGEIRKNGTKVRLQEQPFQVLVTLLGRPGQVVSRDELQRRLWPADTFGDFSHGLNIAVNKVRQALGDSAESPRFVETVARRGYRFIGPVVLVTPSPPTEVPPEGRAPEPMPLAGVATSASTVPETHPVRRTPPLP